MAISLFMAIHCYLPAWQLLHSYLWLLLMCASLFVAISMWLFICGLPARGCFLVPETTNCGEYAQNLQGVCKYYERICRGYATSMQEMCKHYALSTKENAGSRYAIGKQYQRICKDHGFPLISSHFTRGIPKEFIEFHRSSNILQGYPYDFIRCHKLSLHFTGGTP